MSEKTKESEFVRRVTLSTKSTTLERPMDKLVLLEAATGIPEKKDDPGKFA